MAPERSLTYASLSAIAVLLAGCSAEPTRAVDCEGDRCDTVCRPASDPQQRCGARPLNPGYDCPATVAQLHRESIAQGKDGARDWCWHPDAGQFEHRGVCFRQALDGAGGAQQCCYDLDTGGDNCTGTYDEIGVAGGVFRSVDKLRTHWVAGRSYEFGMCDFDALGSESWARRHCNFDVRPWCDLHCSTRCVKADGVVEADCVQHITRAACASEREPFFGGRLCRFSATDCALEFSPVAGQPGICDQYAPAPDVDSTAATCGCGAFDRFVPLDEALYDEGLAVLQSLIDDRED